jgi:putative DNA topoisomerase
MSKIDHSLFSVHEHALEKEYEVCPKCGSETSVKHSKKGPFVGCNNYPNCDYTRSLVEHHETLIKVLDDSECPQCSHPLAVKNGRFGMFIGCTNFPECHFIAQEETKSELPTCPSCKKISTC